MLISQQAQCVVVDLVKYELTVCVLWMKFTNLSNVTVNYNFAKLLVFADLVITITCIMFYYGIYSQFLHCGS